MSCICCGNEKAETYAHCDCWLAVKMVNSFKSDKYLRTEEYALQCVECNMILTKEDAKSLRQDTVNNILLDVYECPRCEGSFAAPRST
jgi:hypothetical protein